MQYRAAKDSMKGVCMSEPPTFGRESSAVQAHMTILQGIIGRMGDNSRSCKMLCVAPVSVILAMAALRGDANHIFIALLPTALFFVLDAYYLALERSFRGSYNDFVDKIHDGRYDASNLYVVPPPESLARGALGAMFKFSVWPFYTFILGTLLLAWWLIS